MHAEDLTPIEPEGDPVARTGATDPAARIDPGGPIDPAAPSSPDGSLFAEATTPLPGGSSRRWWPSTDRGRKATMAALVSGALLAGGIGVAAAATGSGSSASSAAAGNNSGVPGAGTAGPHRQNKGGFGRGALGFGGPGFGGLPGGIIHGQAVVPNGTTNGTATYRTLDVQTGEVTAVSPTSISLKSVDGFTNTYNVDQNTNVDGGRDGIGNVAVGDTALVVGAVDGTNVNAMSVMDQTKMKALRQHWAPPGSAAPPTPPTPPTGGSSSGSSAA